MKLALVAGFIVLYTHVVQIVVQIAPVFRLNQDYYRLLKCHLNMAFNLSGLVSTGPFFYYLVCSPKPSSMNLTNTEMFILVLYLLATVIVSFIADQRGHSFGAAFLVCAFTSPLIGAVLYSPYAPESKTVPNNYVPPAIKEPDWSPEQIKLKKQYETGELTVEEYQKKWNETLK